MHKLLNLMVIITMRNNKLKYIIKVTFIISTLISDTFDITVVN